MKDKTKHLIKDVLIIMMLIVIIFILSCIEGISSNNLDRKVQDIEYEINEIQGQIHALDEEYTLLYSEVYNTYN